MEGRSRFSRSSVRPRFCSQAVSRLLGLTVLEVLVMPPKVAGPGLSGKATHPRTIPPPPQPPAPLVPGMKLPGQSGLTKGRIVGRGHTWSPSCECPPWGDAHWSPPHPLSPMEQRKKLHSHLGLRDMQLTQLSRWAHLLPSPWRGHCP